MIKKETQGYRCRGTKLLKNVRIEIILIIEIILYVTSRNFETDYEFCYFRILFDKNCTR